MDGGVLYKVAYIVKGEEGVADIHRHDVSISLKGDVADETVNAAKTVYSNFDSRG